MTISINTDKKQREHVQSLIKANDGYCICSLKKDEKHRCGPCPDFVESDDEGWCHCHLYYKTKN